MKKEEVVDKKFNQPIARIIYILIFIFGLFYPLQTIQALTEVFADFKLYVNPLLETPGENANWNGIINLFDKNPKTIVWLNTIGENPKLYIQLNKSENFNAIRLEYGPVLDIEGIPVRCIAERVKVTVRNKDLPEYVYENEIYLNTTPDVRSQTIDLSTLVFGDSLQVEILSTIGDQGRQYMVLGDLDLLLNKRSILIFDGPRLTKELGLSRRKYRLESLLKLFSGVRKVIFPDLNRQLNLWKNLGVATELIRIDYENQQSGVYIEIKQSANNSYRGEIYCGIGGGKYYSPDPRKYPYQLIDKMVIGEWSLDGEGTMWVRIGRGSWKKDGEPIFNGTDFGDILALDMPFIRH